jgi:hypothetical protein
MFDVVTGYILYANQLSDQAEQNNAVRIYVCAHYTLLQSISFPEYACSRVMHYLTREHAYSGNEIALQFVYKFN